MSPFHLLISLAVVVSVSASCCMPKKYTTDIRIDSFANGTFYHAKGIQYADVLNGLYVTHATYTDYKGVSTINNYYYNIFTGDSYAVIGGRCTKTHFKIPGFNKGNDNCIPDSAQGPTFIVGGPHEDLEVFKWRSPFENGMLETTMTKHHCLPVYQTMYMKDKAQVTFGHTTIFSSLKQSVDDKSVFVLPDMCKQLTS